MLGQTYAALFPGRVGRMVLDGVIDPVAWYGTRDTRNTPVSLRIGSAQATSQVLRDAMERCRVVGEPRCPLRDPMAAFDEIVTRLQRSPLNVPLEDGSSYQLTYPEFISFASSMLGGAWGAEYVAQEVARIHLLLDSNGSPNDRHDAGHALGRDLQAARSRDRTSSPGTAPASSNTAAYLAVLCGDTLNPADPGAWPIRIRQASRTAPNFAALWGWGSLPCASPDLSSLADAPPSFATATATPILMVGSRHDPVTPYAGTVAAALRARNALLLTSDSWGHLSLASSRCIERHVVRFLTDGDRPHQGVVCAADVEPFSTLTR